MKVRTIKEAWIMADKIFPTDYVIDEISSKAAGYTIFRSTATGNDSWISDLGTSLELNIQKGKGIETVRISIEEPEMNSQCRKEVWEMKKFTNEELLKEIDKELRAQMLRRNIRLGFYVNYGFAPNVDNISLLGSYVSTDEIYIEFIVFSPFASYLYKLHNDNIERIKKL